MSHFTVLVIGEKPEDQLAPYHEFECTGEVDQYVQTVEEDMQEHISDFQKHCKEPGTRLADWLPEWTGKPTLNHGDEPDLLVAHKYGYILLNASGDVEKVFDRTNPNKKWDWYLLGGRWAGFFKLKPNESGNVGEGGLFTPPAKEGYADQAFKASIDFDAMVAEASAKAGAEWDKINEAIKNTEPTPTWEYVREVMFAGDMEGARKFYNDQPRIKAFRSAAENPFSSVDDYQCTRDEFCKKAEDRALSTFALVKDGVWYEKGQMGWWGMVSNEQDQSEWNAKVRYLLGSVPDTTLLSVYDCHI